MSEKRPKDVGEQLRLHAEPFKLLVESVRDYAIFLLNPDGTVASWNAGAQRFKGYTPEEIIGKHFTVFYPPEDHDKGPRLLERAAREGRVEDEGWRVRKDGSRFWADVVITALRDQTGALVGFAKVTRDLTERRAAEEALRRANAELSAKNAELEEYASFVAHDLQEPLRKIASFAELLERVYGKKLDDQARQYIHHVVDGARRMRSLIVDVLEYARIGKNESSMSAVDLGQVIDGAVRDLSVAIEEADGSVEVGPMPRLNGSPQRLQRVFLNLISNGLKYRAPGRPPVVRVTAERRGPEWVVSVSDNGIGFEAKYAERILRPFQRLHPKEQYPGSGLGLAASRKIVELHHGRLWAESEPGKGSTFRIALPAQS